MGRGRAPARTALASYVADQCELILSADTWLQNVPTADETHRARVAIRRLRSTLRTFSASCAVDGEMESLRVFERELRWLAALLGPVRDADVISEEVAAVLDTMPVDLVLGPVAREVAETSATDRARAIEQLWHARAEPRYAAVMSTVRRWLDEPSTGSGPAPKRRLRRAEVRLRQRLAEAAATDDPDDFHRARKAAKRLRYAAEATHDVVREAARAVRTARRVQKALGEHQDQIVLAQYARRLALEHGAAEGHNGFTYGLIHARAVARAAEIRAEFRS